MVSGVKQLIGMFLPDRGRYVIIPSPIYPEVEDISEIGSSGGFVWATDLEEQPSMPFRLQVSCSHAS